ncbi:MAG: glycerophosphodiester phosphodiesterase [Gammaproteobacteria bacterium]|jgi:glycerophosphoryl diester phosphodiesterase|nr:glycerophosphodiester phosphodiesterase [Gammaproteobacteria bacterium]
MSSPIIFAHRGANRLAPENTMAAFHKAVELGAKALEFDVQLSKDFVPVVIHDETLERTTNGHGLVAEHDFAELKKLDAGSWFSPEFSQEALPSLAQVLKTFIPLGLYLNIELKLNMLGAKRLVNNVLTLLKSLSCPAEQILFSSFDVEIMQALADEAGDWPHSVALLIDKIAPPLFVMCQKFSCVGVNPSVMLLRDQMDNNFIAQAQQNNLKVFSYTINDPDEAQRLVSLGLNGFFTDNHLLYNWKFVQGERT